MSNEDTTGSNYTSRLRTLSGAGWKQRLDVQAPYRWNLHRLLGGRRVLDAGCGIGRNLVGLEAGSVGVDHNPHSVEHCRSLGLEAHAAEVLREYLPYVNPGSPVVLICPQERGFATDATHTTFFDFAGLRGLCAEVDLPVQRSYSFPLPRFAGKVFPYNEFVVLAHTR